MSPSRLPRGWALCPLLAGVLVLVASWQIDPLGDDWSTTRPLTSFGLTDLMPVVFFRPFEQLIRGLGGQLPDTYPYLPRLAVWAGHFASALLVGELSRATGASERRQALIATAFLVFPGTMGAALSLDGATQTWSTAWGLAAVLVAVHGGASWPAFAFLAALSKESGVAWFVAAPVLAATLRGPQPLLTELRRLSNWSGLPALALYLALRFVLSGPATSGASYGGYSLVVSPRWFVNGAMLFTAAVLPVDTVALFGRAPWLSWGVASAVAGVPLLLVLGTALRRWSTTQILGFAAVALLVTGPHLPLGRLSELYAHPLAALVFVVAGRWFSSVGTFARAASVLWGLTAVAVSVHKLESMRTSAKGGAAVGAELARLVPRPEPLCVRASNEHPGYSVFDLSPLAAAANGAAVTRQWGYQQVDLQLVADSTTCSPGRRRLRWDKLGGWQRD